MPVSSAENDNPPGKDCGKFAPPERILYPPKDDVSLSPNSSLIC